MFEPTANVRERDFGISPFQRMGQFAFGVGSDAGPIRSLWSQGVSAQ